MNVEMKRYTQRQYLKTSIFIVSAVLFFVAVYSIYPVLAIFSPGQTLDPLCSPNDPDCTVSAPLSTNISTTTNVALSGYTLSFNTSTLYLDPSSGRVGINTTSPLAVLDVNGDLILSGVSRYLNFGSTAGGSGYGVRDNSGTLQFKNSSGSWLNFVTSTALTVDSVGSIELVSTAVTAGAYGSSTHVGSFVVDADGRLTYSTSTLIAITTNQISGIFATTSLTSAVMVEGEDISLLNNNVGYLTTYTETDPIWVAASTSLTVSNFSSPNISQWINNSGYITSNAISLLQITTTTEQLRLGYNASNYTSFIVDANGSLAVSSSKGIALELNPTNNSVNHLLISSSVSGTPIGLTATGTADAIDLKFTPKGTGTLLMNGLLSSYGPGNSIYPVLELYNNVPDVNSKNYFRFINTPNQFGPLTITGAGDEANLGIAINSKGGGAITMSGSNVYLPDIGNLQLRTGGSNVGLNLFSTWGGDHNTYITQREAFGSYSVAGLEFTRDSSAMNFWIGADGKIAAGTNTPSSTMHVLSATEQLRLGYDASNYSSFNVDGSGNLAIGANGTNLFNINSDGRISWGGTNTDLYTRNNFGGGYGAILRFDSLAGNTNLLKLSNGYNGQDITFSIDGPSDGVGFTFQPRSGGAFNVAGLSNLIGTTTITNLVVSTTLSLPLGSIGSNELANTAVTAGVYGADSQTLALTVDADGRLISLSTSSIGIAANQITSGQIGSGYLASNVVLEGENISLLVNNYGYITSSSADILTNKTWNGSAIGAVYGGTGQNTSNWTGFLKLNSGAWSTSTISFSDVSGLGSMATQTASNVLITGGSVTGITDLAVSDGGTGTSTFASGGLVFSNGSILTQNNGNLFWNDSGLKFGIGTNAPSTTLHLVGTAEQLRLGYNAASVGSFTVGSVGDMTVSSTGALILQPTSSTLRFAKSASAYTNWTIGTDGSLTIASGQPTTTFSNNVVIDNLYSGIITMPQDGGQTDAMDVSVSSVATIGTPEGYNFLVDGLNVMSVYGISDGAGSVNSSTIGVSIGTINTSSYRLFVKASTSTSAGLGVDGYIKSTGYITGTTTLDLAESYPIDCSVDGLCPASFDVVCSAEKNGNYVVEKCSDSYASNVVGVVSEKPGFGLGEYDPMTYNPNSGITPSNYRMIALAGRVPVNVSNVNGSIKVGDYLTSSKFPGVAVRASEPGRVIGVALTSSNSATGTVMIFVNPHWDAGSINFVSSELPTEYGLLDQFTMAIKNSLRQLGLIIEKGIAKVKELRTEKLCVGNTCVTETELKQLLQNHGSSSETIVPELSSVSSQNQTTSQSAVQQATTSTTSFTEKTDLDSQSGNTNKPVETVLDAVSSPVVGEATAESTP